jgi:hypothetical protein
MRSDVAVQLSGIHCSSSKHVGDKVRVGCAWNSGGTSPKAVAGPLVHWTPLCILQKSSTPSTQSTAGWVSAAESPLVRGAAASFPDVEVSSDTNMTFSIEIRGLFSSTVACVIVVDVHELVYSGELSGPFTGASSTSGSKTKWMVTGTIQLKEQLGTAVSAVAPAAIPTKQHNLQPYAAPSILLPPSASSQPTSTPPPSTPVAVAPTSAPVLSLPLENILPPKPTPQRSHERHDASLEHAADLSKSVREALDALEFPPFVAAKIFARGVEMSGHGTKSSQLPTSRIAAIILAPCRDPTLSAEDLEFMCDTFSVDLGHSVVTTIGGNAAISSALWRPELASMLNTAGKAFGTNTRSDAATQTGDLAQLLGRDYVAQFDSAAAVALRTDAKEKLENSKAFQILKHDIADANRREMQAVAEAQHLRASLAKAMQQIDELRNGSTDDDDDDLYGVPNVYRGTRRQRTSRSSASVRTLHGGGSNIWNDVLSSSQSAVSTPSRRKHRQAVSLSPPTVRPLVASQLSSFRSRASTAVQSMTSKAPLSQDVFQTGAQVGVRGRSRSIGFSDDDIL